MDWRYIEWRNRNQLSLWLVMVTAASLSVGSLFLLKNYDLLLLAFILSLSVAYQLFLRNIGLLKPVIVALVCSLTFVTLPNHHASGISLWKLTALAFPFLLANLLLFEIKDVETDERHGLRTWPIIVGIKLTAFLSVAALIISAILPFRQFHDSYVPLFFAYAMPHLICIQSIWYGVHKKNDPYFYWVVVEGWLLLAGSYALVIKWIQL
ncbi:MAG: UbiA family prenyltransferase [Chitinophagales bacterium]